MTSKSRKAIPRRESTELHDLELVIRAEELQVKTIGLQCWNDA